MRTVAAASGTDVDTYTRERPGVSAFAREDGIVYHTYSAYSRGVDGLWGMYQWLDRAPQGAQRAGRLVAPPRRVQQGLSEVVRRDALAGSTASGEDVVRCGWPTKPSRVGRSRRHNEEDRS